MAEIAIVGAGMAGLAAGRALAAAGHAVRVYEKSRGVGGRLATRRVDGFSFDHGAQYFRAPTAELAALAAASGAVDIGRPVWVFDSASRVAEGDPAQNAEPKWTWAAGATALAHHLADGLPIAFETLVASFDTTPDPGAPFGRRYTLRDGSNAALGAADAILLTPPAPQTAALVAAGVLETERRELLLEALGQIRYRRSIALTFAYDRRPDVPWYALVNADRGHAISWLACEHDKPGRAPEGAGLLIAQMADSWSATHWEELAKGHFAWADAPPEPAVAAAALVAALVGQELGPPRWVNLQRWRWALPDNAIDVAGLNALRDGLYLAGDMAAGQGRLHLAIQAGWRAAERIAADIAAPAEG